MKKMLLSIGILALLVVVPNFTAAESTNPEINEQIKATVNDGPYLSATIKSNGNTEISNGACFFANPIRKFILPDGKYFTIFGNAEIYLKIFNKIFGGIFGPTDPLVDYITLEIQSGSSLVVKRLGTTETLESGDIIKFTKFVGFVQFESNTDGDGKLTYISGRVYGVTIERAPIES